MSLSVQCSSYLLSKGAHTVSLPHPPHLYPSAKQTESKRLDWDGRVGGGDSGQRYSDSRYYKSSSGSSIALAAAVTAEVMLEIVLQHQKEIKVTVADC